MKHSRFIFGLLTPMILMGIVNWYVNPLRVFAHESGYYDISMTPMLRMSIAFNNRRMKPDAIIFGTSRAKALPTDPSLWGEDVVQNASMDAASLEEILLYMRGMYYGHPYRTAIIGLDFNAFNGGLRPGFEADRLVSQENTIATKFAFRSRILKDVYQSLFSGRATATSVIYVLEKSFPAFGSKLKYFLVKISPLERPQSSNGQIPKEAWGYLSSMLAFAKENDIELKFFITPYYAPYFEGRFGDYVANLEEWKKGLVTRLRSFQSETGVEVPLWSFDGYNSITTEPFDQKDGFESMQWFYEKDHYSERVGRFILERLLGRCTAICDAPSDFGVELRTDNIERHLSEWREDRLNYLRMNPDLPETIRKVFQ